MKLKSQPTSARATALLTIKELARELRMSVRGVQDLTARGAIPVIRISRKCIRYSLSRVLEALARLEQKEVGASL